ncbi:MAG: putative biotin transporter bioY [Methanomicrobia archaeon]|jgi:biotin transport system substrate-specific component|nr:putative biotin transporter bioY [Methanomicrobia archaeon]MDD1634006.1 biotin transporter BioY [Methanomicrobiales archaeon]MBS1195200.1 putative biotin transporter bioY [Methanomicrobia archaeon]MDD1639068.1 biotin transporter BioY [Methanomicrobiales archaeon]MDD1644990.1 biotin transporter BioY [Methanomicrobiales archaeon]
MYGNEERAAIIAQSAGFTALIAAGGWIALPMVPVPITLQTFFVLLSGVVMKRYAVVPATLYVLLGALGLPLFHSGLSGPGVLLGPTGGYLVGFILAAGITGLGYEQENAWVRAAALILATCVIYVCGAGWLAVSTGMPVLAAAAIGVLPFIPGDAVKAAAVYALGRSLA